MARGTFRTDYLPHFLGSESPNDGRAQHKRQQQRGDRGTGSAEADVVEESESAVLLAERGEPVIEHQSSTGTERCRGCTGFFARSTSAGIIRSIATPRDALSTTTSSPLRRAASAGARANGSAARNSLSPRALA